MKAFNGFEAKKASGGRELLPAGGYVARIMGAEIMTYSWGERLVISFDIAEGDQKEFFANDYRAQDREDKKWRGTYRLNVPDEKSQYYDGQKRTFGNMVWAAEESNPGYHWDWDEGTLKGKLIGVLFRNREWEINGRTGWTTECCAVTSVQDIQNGEFKMPRDKPLPQKAPVRDVYAAVNDTDDDDLPFN